MTHSHVLVVIDHQETRVYATDLSDTEPTRLYPDDPNGDRRHLHHTSGHFQGQRAPEDPRYYEQIALLLRDAGEILIFGNGRGKSSAMMYLVRYLTKQHAAIADRIVGAVIVDIAALTDHQLLAEARDFYAEKATQ